MKPRSPLIDGKGDKQGDFSVRPVVIFLGLLAGAVFLGTQWSSITSQDQPLLSSVLEFVESTAEISESATGSAEPTGEPIVLAAADPEPTPVIEPINGIEQPGQRFLIRAEDLPPVGATKTAVNFPRPTPLQDGDELYLPDGFQAQIFSRDISSPRWLVTAPNGDVFVSVTGSRRAQVDNANTIWILRDTDGDFVADQKFLFADGFDMPLGMALTDEALFVADIQGVWRLPYVVGNITATERERLTPEGAMGTQIGSHFHRLIALSPDGKHMYVTAGSRANVAEEPVPHGRVMRFNMDGSDQQTFAAGLRNPVGTVFHPETGELYTVVNERDGYGDDLVPDFFTRVQKGDFYGWPYAYIGGIPDPKLGDVRPDLVAATKMPDVLFQSHSAPIGLHFYTGEQFPADYKGDAFVTLHGSWNRAEPTGYKLVRIRFENGRPIGGYENFLTGFMRPDGEDMRILARPTGLTELNDGSLLMAEDGNDIIWRISYVGE